MKKMIFTIVLFLLSSCGKQDFKEVYQLNELRVLATLSDVSEVNSDQTVNLRPYVSDPNGQGGSLRVEWSVCPSPAVNYGANANCDDTASPLKEAGDYVVDMASLSTFQYTGEIDGFSFEIKNEWWNLFSGQDEKTKFNGWPLLVTITVTNTTTNQVHQLIRTIKLTNRLAPLNQNPNRASSILQNGNEVTSFPEGEVFLKLNRKESPENYEVQTFTGRENQTEKLWISWYSTHGEFPNSYSDNGEQVLFYGHSLLASEQKGVIVAVVRDGRGGVSVIRFVSP